MAEQHTGTRIVQRGKKKKHLKFSYKTGRVEALPGKAELFGENAKSFWVKERKHVNKGERLARGFEL